MDAFHTPDKQFFESPRLWIPALVVILLAGLGVRLLDLSDPPLDFHPTRQLLSALKARGIYYQDRTDVEDWRRDYAIREWKIRAQVEPEVFEYLVAWTYRWTGEALWVARLYSSIFWTLAALLLFWLTRHLLSTDAGLVAAAAHLFLPYGITASRSFQPDPLMVLLVVAFWWAMAGWARSTWPGAVPAHAATAGLERPRLTRGWKWAIGAGLLGGFAIYVKLVAAFFVIAGGLGLVLGREPLRNLARRPQLWLMASLGALPGGLYVVSGVWFTGYLGQQFGGRFIPELLLDPSYYFGWLSSLNLVIGPAVLTMALLGLLSLRAKWPLRFALWLWVGYVLFSVYFNYHVSTHDYYSLPLIPIAAFSVASLLSLGLLELARLDRRGRTLTLLILLAGLGAIVWDRRGSFRAEDYRADAVRWAELGERLGPDARVVALTQDYGMRLAYWGWLEPSVWPTTADAAYHALRGSQPDFEGQYARLTQNREFFLVTDFKQLDRQPDLKRRLYTLDLVAEQAGEYAMFRLATEPGG